MLRKDRRDERDTLDDVLKNELDNDLRIKDKNINIAKVVDSGNAFVDVTVDSESKARVRTLSDEIRDRRRK
ncbi:hypothetical protein JCM9140_2802 [Halalkalibacter wakoensis JCM 9140]|uniref:Uncharacterized protein n=1 Tax=Halalkalibacter wakoensis JCM 9140 TaxID=1236970 RepID=W4Q3Z8_9BACI|nr:hypothetical protein [Halalkalibacter wakoensis]GAE26712.1 hypothetical protein JCM9140_2802 [Halalkalibacter wakoensis JCM 9140]